MNNTQKVAILDLMGDVLDDNDEEILTMEMMDSESDSSSDSIKQPKVTDFLAIIDAYDDENFKLNMRIKRETIEFLIGRFEQEFTYFNTPKNSGTPKLKAKPMVYMYIWYIGNTITYSQLARQFGVTKCTAWAVVRRVTNWMLSLSHEYLKWPNGAEVEESWQKFQLRNKIPGVIGAIGATHIYINAPLQDTECYLNSKEKYSIVLQAVVDADKKFISLYCGEPGSLDDSCILRRSELYRRAEASINQYFPNGTFLFGDNSYDHTNWLITPFRDREHLTDEQKKFNLIHLATRKTVQTAFGSLKGRFRRLVQFNEYHDILSVVKMVISACVLHNICIIKDDEFRTEELIVESDNEEETADNEFIYYIRAARPNGRPPNRRNDLFNYLIENRIL